MLRDHRPYAVKKAFRRFERFYTEHFLRPQLSALGPYHTFMCPWNVEIFGGPVRVGRCANIVASRDMKVRLAVWSDRETAAGIRVGDYVLICPGVRVSSAVGVTIGDGTMLANGVYVTDSDWHDLYNRIEPCRQSSPVDIGRNVWVGDHAIVCKGVSIGENSVIGAGSVVVSDVPANAVAAGNPARVVKELDPGERMVTRAEWFRDPERLQRDIEYIDWHGLRGNTLGGWLRSLLFPRRGD